MPTPTSDSPRLQPTQGMLNKVPEITLWFWTIKILSTTIGEAGADYLAFNLGIGMPATAALMAILLATALAFQLHGRRYSPLPYWLTVVLISVVGTLVTDLLTDVAGVSLYVSTAAFSVALIVVLTVWGLHERTLSMHAINTPARERYYWLAIFTTFALGTAAGDLTAEALGWGYALAAVIFGALIAATTVAHFAFRLNGVAAFWIAYVLTRPFGAALGDLLSQPAAQGGLGFGPAVVSLAFSVAIALMVAYLMVRERRVRA